VGKEVLGMKRTERAKVKKTERKEKNERKEESVNPRI
jgi:hypothetical protein